MDADRIERLIVARKAKKNATTFSAAAAERLIARAMSSRRYTIEATRKDRAIRLAGEVYRTRKRPT